MLTADPEKAVANKENAYAPSGPTIDLIRVLAFQDLDRKLTSPNLHKMAHEEMQGVSLRAGL